MSCRGETAIFGTARPTRSQKNNRNKRLVPFETPGQQPTTVFHGKRSGVQLEGDGCASSGRGAREHAHGGQLRRVVPHRMGLGAGATLTDRDDDHDDDGVLTSAHFPKTLSVATKKNKKTAG